MGYKRDDILSGIILYMRVKNMSNTSQNENSRSLVQNYSKANYKSDFLDCEAKRKAAFELAHKIREFEINLYWKRAAYFWTFISAALAGYALIETRAFASQDMLALLLACTGFIFALGWFLVNRGSKFWQENWENHVDNLEDDVVGPLYKVTLSRPSPKGIDEKVKHALTGPSTISVSKVNQIISLYVTLLWGILIVNSLIPISPELPPDPIKIAILMTTLLTVGTFFRYGWSHAAPMRQVIRKRDVDFHAKENEPKPSM